MAMKKTALYSSLWASCDELRGGMDASQYKDYVLTLLFVKYVSDKHEGNRNALLSVPKGGSFKDMLAFKGKKDIGDKLNKIISKLADENDLKGVIDVADFNDEDKLGKGKDMQDRLSKLLGIFENLDLKTNRAEGDDLLGDAYEYLMRHFATESGKSKGQFYTPAEVSRILAKVVGINEKTKRSQTVYDMTCGSGSLLLKVADEAPKGISIYGQEMDNSTYSLARMNMILHGHEEAEIWKDNTLADPYWKEKNGQLKMFDYAVANPPFSFKSWANGVDTEEDPYNRFEYGTPPDKNGDYAFLLHMIKSLKSKGKGAIILPHGVLFRGNTEGDIRRDLIKQGYIKGVIGLPANLFYGTGIPACIIVIDKEDASNREGIFMVDASKGFMKDGNKNRLRSQDIHKVVDVFSRQVELDRFSRMVPLSEIKDNDYNLNIPRYVDSSEEEDIHDLDAHLNGGIPQHDIDLLSKYWKHLPNIRKKLFKANGRKGYFEPKYKSHEIKAVVLEHPDYQKFAETSIGIFEKWKGKHLKSMMNLKVGANPKKFIFDISEDLLKAFEQAPMIDKYDVYQHLMNYWSDVMQDDVFIISQDGWEQGKVLREIIEEKKDKKSKDDKETKKIKEVPDLVVKKRKYKADLIPPELIVKKYFKKDKEEINKLQGQVDNLVQEVEGHVEEHSGEDGILESGKNDKGKVTKNILKAEIKNFDPKSNQEEIKVFKKCLALIEEQSSLEKKVKEAQAKLDEKVLVKYSRLSVADIKEIVVNMKWVNTLFSLTNREIEKVITQLLERIKDLEERYESPLSQIDSELVETQKKVNIYLGKMGVL